MGPSFIKFGQFLATRADLIGEEMSADLSELQDRLQPFPFKDAKKTIEDELGRPLEELFSQFDEKPISAASIAQVHFAVTRETDPDVPAREVAVKVLRPGIEVAFERDLRLFYYLAYLVERTQPWTRRFRPVEVVRLFEATVRTEMDLRMEAAAASELGENFREDPNYHVPEIDWERTAQRVVTRPDFQAFASTPRGAAGFRARPDGVLTKASEIFFNQVFRDGFFHMISIRAICCSA